MKALKSIFIIKLFSTSAKQISAIQFIVRLLVHTLLFVPIVALAHLPTTQHNTVNTIAPMLKNVTPAIVNISVENEQLTKLNKLIPTQDDQTKVPVKAYAVGSGVIFDAAKGYIVTNAHVVTRSEEHTSELQSQSNLVWRLLLA